MKDKQPHDIDVIVGKNVRLLRNQRKITQSLLADALGMTFQQVQKYEKGTNRISASKLFEIAEYFSVGISTFYTGTKNEEGERSVILPLGKDALDIAYAFEKISDPRVRKSIKGFVKTVGQT